MHAHMSGAVGLLHLRDRTAGGALGWWEQPASSPASRNDPVGQFLVAADHADGASGTRTAATAVATGPCTATRSAYGTARIRWPGDTETISCALAT